MAKTRSIVALLVLCVVSDVVYALVFRGPGETTVQSPPKASSRTTSPAGSCTTGRRHADHCSSKNGDGDGGGGGGALLDRRSAVATLVLLPSLAANADTGVEVRGTSINAFNGLTFNYRGNDFNGLDAKDIDEPSITYSDFVTKLKAGEVTYVEFYAPDGDVAYATLKDSSRAIRIGEGYPIEQHDGYSSPAFAIRTVMNSGVPFKFVVPAMKKR
jgi:hypothetical protein